MKIHHFISADINFFCTGVRYIYNNNKWILINKQILRIELTAMMLVRLVCFSCLRSWPWETVRECNVNGGNVVIEQILEYRTYDYHRVCGLLHLFEKQGNLHVDWS